MDINDWVNASADGYASKKAMMSWSFKPEDVLRGQLLAYEVVALALANLGGKANLADAMKLAVELLRGGGYQHSFTDRLAESGIVSPKGGIHAGYAEALNALVAVQQIIEKP